jgi:hypothetical protein
MYNRKITLAPDRPNFPLTPVWCGCGSALKFLLDEDTVPVDLYSCLIAITPVGGGTAQAYVGVKNATTGIWEIYVPGWGVPTVGETQYEVVLTVGTEAANTTYWAGKGILTVWAASTSAEIPIAPFLPKDLYVYDDEVHLYFRVFSTRDPITGLRVVTQSQEGVANVP